MTRPMRLGQLGESLAANFLTEAGYLMLGQNVRLGRLGEIDLVCLSIDRHTLVLVEVKTVSAQNRSQLDPTDQMTPVKLKRLRQLATAYVQAYPQYQSLRIRLDFIGVLLTNGTPHIDHRSGILE